MANIASNLKGFFKRNPLGGASLIVVVFLLTVGITSDLLVGDGKNGDITFTGWSETQGDYTYMSGPPNGDHWFGTDQTGRDIFSRIIMGTKRSLIVAIVSVAVLAARATGASSLRIMFRHVAPQCFAPYMVLATAHLGVAILIEASLGFLGAGVPAPAATWGNMLALANAGSFKPLWWFVTFPGVSITVTVLAFNLLGDALRDEMDPRLRGRGL